VAAVGFLPVCQKASDRERKAAMQQILPIDFYHLQPIDISTHRVILPADNIIMITRLLLKMTRADKGTILPDNGVTQ